MTDNNSVRPARNKLGVELTNHCIEHFRQVYAQQVQHIETAHGAAFSQSAIAALHIFAGQLAGYLSAHPEMSEELVVKMAKLNFETGFEHGKAAGEVEQRGGKLDG